MKPQTHQREVIKIENGKTVIYLQFGLQTESNGEIHWQAPMQKIWTTSNAQGGFYVIQNR